MKEERHLITIYPSMKFGQPCIDHRRITVEQVAEIWWYGSMTLEEMERAWAGINRGAVLVCCWYMARYGSRTWRNRWKDWLEFADVELWYGKYKTCPMPHPRDEAGVNYEKNTIEACEQKT